MSAPELDPTSTALVGAARQLNAQLTRAAVLGKIVMLAPEAVPGAQHVSVTVLGKEGLVTVAASGSPAGLLDALQWEVGEGPCIAALEGEPVVVADLHTDVRWPRLVSRLRDREAICSVLSLPLWTGDEVSGSLNLSSTGVGAFAGAGYRAGVLFAALAGLALAAADQRERAAERAAYAAQGEEFIALLAHDLRSGMTASLLSEEIFAAQRANLDSDGQEALDLLTEELDRQHHLLVELLDLTRARAELASTRATPLLSEVQRAVDGAGCAVPVRPHPGAADVLVPVHPVRLRRILANLLDNAHRHAGGATAVEVGRCGDQAWVAVEDGGPGVPVDLREAVFTRFVAGSVRSGQAGAHLGLALSRQHARLTGGDLRVEDRDGGGARFVLLLPAINRESDSRRSLDEF